MESNINLSCLILNCTLKRTPEKSNTGALLAKVASEFQKLGVSTETVRVVDHNIAPGTSANEGPGDEWPILLEKIKKCDILIIGSPIWVGHLGSVAQRVIERMDAVFHDKQLQDEKTGQYFPYNKTAGVVITGNEDGAHACIMRVQWALQEFGFTVPPNSNTYWVGEVGPGPSYSEAGGERHLYTNKTFRYMVHNLVYFARLLRSNPIPTNLNELSKAAEAESDS